MDNQIVVFELASELYGVNIANVESIIKIQPITRMPQSPVFVVGIINLRGKVLPVINLRQRFGLPVIADEKNSRIIVISTNATEVGMIVDGVSEVLTLNDQVIEPAPEISTTVDSSFITGIAKVEQRLVILLDLDRVLTKSEKENLKGISATAS